MRGEVERVRAGQGRRQGHREDELKTGWLLYLFFVAFVLGGISKVFEQSVSESSRGESVLVCASDALIKVDGE